MQCFAAMSFRTGDKVHQSGERALVIQKLISAVVSESIGDQERCRHQNDIGLVVLSILISREIEAYPVEDQPREGIAKTAAGCNRRGPQTAESPAA